jgi:hypothetical protein
MKLTPQSLLWLACLPGCSSFQAVKPEPLVHGVSAYLGRRNLEDSDKLDGLGKLETIGAQYDVRAPHAALGWELALFQGRDTADLPGGSLEARVTELAGGVRKTFEPGQLGVRGLYPYVGGGLSLFFTESERRSAGLPDASDEDFDVGPYVHIGVYGRFFDRLRIGVDYRLVREEFLDHGGFDLDGDQLALTLGVSF